MIVLYYIRNADLKENYVLYRRVARLANGPEHKILAFVRETLQELSTEIVGIEESLLHAIYIACENSRWYALGSA